MVVYTDRESKNIDKKLEQRIKRLEKVVSCEK